MFDQIDEQRVYSSNWQEELGCNDFYVRGALGDTDILAVPDVTVTMGTKDIPAMMSLLPKITYVTQQEHDLAPKNWSMAGQISDELFVKCWTRASKKRSFFSLIEEHIKELTKDRPIYGTGADFFKNKRILIRTKGSFFKSQHQALPVGTCRNMRYYELCLTQKRYFKIDSYEQLKGCCDGVPWATMLLGVPAYVLSPNTNATSRLVEKRRLSLKKKGFNLRKKRHW